MSRHLSTRSISSKSMHAFFSNLANRQTDRQTNTSKTCTSSFVGGKYVPIMYRYWHIRRPILVWPWNLGYSSLKVIEYNTIRKLGYGFLFAFHSNYDRIFSCFDTIHERDGQTDRHRTTAWAALIHSIARQKSFSRKFVMVTYIVAHRQVEVKQSQSTKVINGQYGVGELDSLH